MFIHIGRKVIDFLLEWGRITQLMGKVLSRILKGKLHFRRTLTQMLALGVESQAISYITALFVGMAFSIQVVREFLRFGGGDMVGYVVAMGIWRELAPLLTAVVVSGRVGAAITAEIGTMKVTEQVEALEAMSQDPVDYLVIPRVVACTIMLPLLVGVADIIGFFAGFSVAVSTQRINPYAFFDSAQTFLFPVDIYGGLIKAVVFGFLIAILSCYMGLKTTGGAKGVGEMTTKSVVVSLISIFILNYFLSLVIY
jgi:phospholipid/cholesterol/gamma-HCH transport system permease protein